MTRPLVRIACLWIAVGVLLACAGAPRSVAIDIVPDTSAPMRPGDHARLPDRSRLAYVGLRGDSRCPPGVACVHAGWAELDFVHRSPTGPRQAFVLTTRAGAAPVEAGGWRFALDEVGRGASPIAHVRIFATGD